MIDKYWIMWFHSFHERTLGGLTERESCLYWRLIPPHTADYWNLPIMQRSVPLPVKVFIEQVCLISMKPIWANIERQTANQIKWLYPININLYKVPMILSTVECKRYAIQTRTIEQMVILIRRRMNDDREWRPQTLSRLKVKVLTLTTGRSTLG